MRCISADCCRRWCHDPRTSVQTLFLAGEPGMSVAATRKRIEELWNARIVEFYGCTKRRPTSAAIPVRRSRPTLRSRPI